VQPVPGAPWRLSSGRTIWLAVALAALALAGAAALLARDPAPAPAPAPAVKSDLAVIGGKPLQQASCEEWLHGTADERAAVIATLRRTAGGGTPYGPGATLTTADAYALFERACARPYARGFLLYELYNRSAAFQSTPQRFQ
jgi:hypothetical protein